MRHHKKNAVTAMLANVTGTPMRACRRQSMTTPRRAAASTTMMLAMLRGFVDAGAA
jgi:hypothetical protein